MHTVLKLNDHWWQLWFTKYDVNLFELWTLLIVVDRARSVCYSSPRCPYKQNLLNSHLFWEQSHLEKISILGFQPRTFYFNSHCIHKVAPLHTCCANLYTPVMYQLSCTPPYLSCTPPHLSCTPPHLSFINCHVPLHTCHVPLHTCHVSTVMYPSTPVMYQLSCTPPHLSCINCNVPLHTCHVSTVMYPSTPVMHPSTPIMHPSTLVMHTCHAHVYKSKYMKNYFTQ